MASVSEVEMTAKNISRVPSTAACILSMPRSIRLKIFSVTTIPSSTTKPVASTIPNSVSTLMEYPKIYITKKVPISETGISINGRKAMIQLRKNRKIIITTRKMEINKVSNTSVTD